MLDMGRIREKRTTNCARVFTLLLLLFAIDAGRCLDEKKNATSDSPVPIVLWHGMGESHCSIASCFQSLALVITIQYSIVSYNIAYTLHIRLYSYILLLSNKCSLSIHFLCALFLFLPTSTNAGLTL